MSKCPQCPRLSTQSGASLIEVLVAVLVLSIGFLGMAGLQARALKGNHSSLQRTQAVMLNNYALDAIRIDRLNAVTTALPFNMAKTCTVPTDTSSLAANVKKDWIQALKTNLGNVSTTCGTITCSVSGICTVEIEWDDSRAGGGAAQKLATTTQL